jgi:hypothetical protein
MPSDFEKSLSDIEGLTAYRPRTLPRWLRERLQEGFPKSASDTDAELVSKYFARFGPPWLNEWGTAIIAGEEVFICESDGLLDPVCRAADLELGFVLVESSEREFEIGFTIYFTEGFRTKHEPSRWEDGCAVGKKRSSGHLSSWRFRGDRSSRTGGWKSRDAKPSWP